MATSTDLVADLKNKTICPLCLDNLTNPRLLPCAHTFCFECLDKCIARSRQRFECPLCRAHIAVPQKRADGFPVNITIVGIQETLKKHKQNVQKCQEGKICELCLQDSAPAEYRCDECMKIMCSRCKAIHDKVSIGHKVHHVTATAATKIPVVKKSDYCSEHRNEFVRFYCQNCDEIICHVCKQLNHRRPHHKCQNLLNANQEWLSELAKLRSEARDIRKNLADQINELGTTVDSRQVQEREVYESIKERKEEIITSIEEHFSQVKASVQKISACNQEKIDKRKQMLQNQLLKIDRWFDMFPNSTMHANRNGDLKDDLNFLRNLMNTNRKIQQEKRVDFTKHALVEGDVDASDLKKQLNHVRVMEEETISVISDPIGVSSMTDTRVDRNRRRNSSLKIVIGSGSSKAAIYDARNPSEVVFLQPPTDVAVWNPVNVVCDDEHVFVVNYAGSTCSAGGGLYQYNSSGEWVGVPLPNFGFINDVAVNENMFTVVRGNNTLISPTMVYQYSDHNGCPLNFIRRDQANAIEKPQFIAEHNHEGFSVVSHSKGVSAIRYGEEIWFYACKNQKPGKLLSPSGVAVNQTDKGEVYVADRATGRILILSRKGRFLSEFSVSSGEGIEGVALDEMQNVYVVNRITDQLHIFRMSNNQEN